MEDDNLDSSQTNFGTPGSQTQTVYVNVDRKSNGLGVAGFILALLTFVFCWVPVLDFILWFLGALFSFIGIFKRPRGLAIAGLVISFIGIIILLIFFGSIIASSR